MKLIPAISFAAFLGLTACDTINQPITSGDFDPLRPPGSNTVSTSSTSDGLTFKAGQFVQAVMDNTAFYVKKPKGDAEANKLLKRGTSVKVVANSDSYTKVELDSGEVGFIPAVMLVDPAASTPVPTTNPGEYQVYPPLPGGPVEPLPVIDPASQPLPDSIPTVIDPDAPASTAPVPSVNPPTEVFPAPAPAPATPTPAPTPEEKKEAVPQ